MGRARARVWRSKQTNSKQTPVKVYATSYLNVYHTSIFHMVTTHKITPMRTLQTHTAHTERHIPTASSSSSSSTHGQRECKHALERNADENKRPGDLLTQTTHCLAGQKPGPTLTQTAEPQSEYCGVEKRNTICAWSIENSLYYRIVWLISPLVRSRSLDVRALRPRMIRSKTSR